MAAVATLPVRKAPAKPVSMDRELASLVVGAAAADRLRPSGLSHILLVSVVGFFVVATLWANWATLEEVTRGDGKVIPSRQIQIIQNLEGGILAAVLAREGEAVEEGQVVLRIDNSRSSSDYKEKLGRFLSLLATTARLQAEVNEKPIVFSPEVMTEARELAMQEQRLYNSRQETLQSQIQVLQQQAQQREQELKELESKLRLNERMAALADEELRQIEPLAKQRIASQADYIRVQQKALELKGSVESTRLAIPRVRSAIREANQKIEGAFSQFRSEAQEELNQRSTELASLREIVSAGEDRVRRTEVRSPVKGTIKQIKATTIGGVIQPGADIMEIVPTEDTLLVEANVRPADIAFLRPGLPATVKITAYDFSIYGGLKGQVEDISADTIANERGESFYRVRVRTDETELKGTNGQSYAIIPGMTAQVDVLTGHKTVMQYLLKPLIRARHNALTER